MGFEGLGEVAEAPAPIIGTFVALLYVVVTMLIILRWMSTFGGVWVKINDKRPKYQESWIKIKISRFILIKSAQTLLHCSSCI